MLYWVSVLVFVCMCVISAYKCSCSLVYVLLCVCSIVRSMCAGVCVCSRMCVFVFRLLFLCVCVFYFVCMCLYLFVCVCVCVCVCRGDVFTVVCVMCGMCPHVRGCEWRLCGRFLFAVSGLFGHCFVFSGIYMWDFWVFVCTLKKAILTKLKLKESGKDYIMSHEYLSSPSSWRRENSMNLSFLPCPSLSPVTLLFEQDNIRQASILFHSSKEPTVVF